MSDELERKHPVSDDDETQDDDVERAQEASRPRRATRTTSDDVEAHRKHGGA